MAENATWAAGENRSHPSALEAELSMADRVDATVNQVERTTLQPSANLPSADSCRQQLPPAHHPVLPLRNGGKHSIDAPSAAFGTEQVLDVGFLHDEPIVTRSDAAIARITSRLPHATEAPARRYRLWL